MTPAVTRKLRAALSLMSFCTQRKSPQAASTRAEPAPIGAAYYGRAARQRQTAQVDEAAAAQGIRDGAGRSHAGGVPQGDAGVRGRMTEHLLRPRHRRHRIAHGSRVEGVAAIAAEDLFADEDTGHDGSGEDIPVHRRRHQQCDDEGEALVGIVPGPVDAASAAAR